MMTEENIDEYLTTVKTSFLAYNQLVTNAHKEATHKIELNLKNQQPKKKVK